MRAPFFSRRSGGSARGGSGRLGRRDLLRLFAALPAAAAVTACGSEPEPDPLEPLAHAARADAALAQGVARTHTALAGPAGAVAAARGEHARLLQQEIDRLNPPDKPQRHRVAPPRVPGSAAEAKAALQQAVGAGQRQAAQVCPGLPGYRAGLTGSVSASCASLAEVLA